MKVLCSYDTASNGLMDCFSTPYTEVQENGGLRIVSTAQRMIRNGVVLPLPVFLRGRAVITEWYDDQTEAFFVHVRVRNLLVGTFFEYRGSFRTEYVDMPVVNIPAHIKPARKQRRE
jgi:hypothetical protein